MTVPPGVMIPSEGSVSLVELGGGFVPLEGIRRIQLVIRFSGFAVPPASLVPRWRKSLRRRQKNKQQNAMLRTTDPKTTPKTGATHFGRLDLLLLGTAVGIRVG